MRLLRWSATGLLLFQSLYTLATSHIQQSVTPRRLEDNPYFEYDLSQFSLRFEKCQYVKMFDDELAEDEDSSSPFALKHFVIYRLCPTDTCTSTCDVYGRYVTDVESFLKFTVENQERYLEDMCQNCEENCGDNNNNNQNEQNDDANGDDDQNNSYDCGCSTICDRYENLEEYGYIDASEYMECQEFKVENDNNNNNANDDGNDNDDEAANEDEDANNNDEDNVMYIGPRCSQSGNRITIGLFYDEDCWEPIDGVDVEDLLGAKLSYHLLAPSYYENDRVCLSCKEANNDGDDNNNNDDANDNDQYDADDVNEMCEDLYDNAAKCESKTGLEYGFIQTKREEDDYENQIENEFMACNFIDSLIWDSYTETGEINVGEPQDEIVRYVTDNQKITLSLLGAIILCLVCAMEYFRRKIANVAPQLQLTGQSSVLT